jgi:hypothetical protein
MNMYPQTLLVLKCAEDVTEEEINSVLSLAQLHDIEGTVVDKSSGQDIAKSTEGKCFSLVYLAGHGNYQQFGPKDGECQSWKEVAAELCGTACIQPGSVVFCACCHGGLHTVAHEFFCACPTVENVCGPRGSIFPTTLLVAFHVLMYNLFFRNAGPEEACRIAQEASGHAFTLHAQQEFLANSQPMFENSQSESFAPETTA